MTVTLKHGIHRIPIGSVWPLHSNRISTSDVAAGLEHFVVLIVFVLGPHLGLMTILVGLQKATSSSPRVVRI